MSFVKLQDVADELGKPVATILREAHSADLAIWVPAQALQEQLDRELKAPTSGSEDEIFGGVYRELGLRNRYRFLPMKAIVSESSSTEAFKLPQLPVPALVEVKIREFEEIGKIVGWQRHAEVCTLEDQADRLFSLLPHQILELRSKKVITISHLGSIDSQRPDTAKIINWFPFCQFKIGVESLVINDGDEELLILPKRAGKARREQGEPAIGLGGTDQASCEQHHAGIMGEDYWPLRDLLLQIAKLENRETISRIEFFWGMIKSELRKTKPSSRRFDKEQQILLQWEFGKEQKKEAARAFIWRDGNNRERKCTRKTLGNHLCTLAKYYPKIAGH
jgi:hypothetical protein